MSNIRLDTGAHWYLRDGTPKHGGSKDYDLRDARKDNAYPSVTSVDKDTFKNIALENYKTLQLLDAASNHARQPHETVEDYQQRLYDLSREHASAAADFGNDIHKCADHYPNLPLDPNLLPYFNHYAKWHEANILETVYSECSLTDHSLGVGGRCDRIAIHKELGRCIIDIKTQGVKKSKAGIKKPAFYDSWVRQLAFYGGCDAKLASYWPRMPACISVVIDSTEPDEPFIKVWTKDEVREAWKDFSIAVYQWMKKRKYWPALDGEFNVQTNLEMPL